MNIKNTNIMFNNQLPGQQIIMDNETLGNVEEYMEIS